jgi:hypothetical protein
MECSTRTSLTLGSCSLPYNSPNSSDRHPGNVKFKENASGLTKANLIDWGQAEELYPKGKPVSPTQTEKNWIVRVFASSFYHSL